MTYLLVGLGSALGGIARYWCSMRIVASMGGAFPWGTLFVNVVGSCLIGATFGLLQSGGRIEWSTTGRDSINYFFMIGVLGGFTTFSAFSLQTLTLLRDQQWWQAGANVAVSIVACLVAVALGFWSAMALNRI